MTEKAQVKVDREIHRKVKKFLEKETKGEIGFFYDQAAKEKLEKELLKKEQRV